MVRLCTRAIVMASSAALAFAPLPAIAGAPARPDFAVAALEIDGEIPDFWYPEISKQVHDALAEAADVRALVAADCTPERCSDDALAGATHLVRVSVREQARRYTVALSVLELASGERIESREECPLCGLAEVGQLAAGQARALLRKLDSRADAMGIVTVLTRPAGAEITVDGEPHGRTPATLSLPPGTHDIALYRPGYNRTQRRVEAVADVRETWSAELVPRDQRRPRARAMTIAGGVMLGLMAPALITGSTLLALDGKPYRRRCSGPDVDTDGDCRLRYSSSAQGGVMIGLAAALALGGIVLLTQARGRAVPANQRARAAR